MEYRNVFERLLWFCIYIVLISGTLFIVVTLWDRFLIHPTVTTLVSSTHPINKVAFPGISVCSINKISRRRAQRLANEIANKTGYDTKKIMTYMRFIGQLYDFDFEPSTVSQLLEFQNILDTLGINIIDITKQTAPSCNQLLRACSWRNVKVNCLNVFDTRLTHHGYCCTFNYVKWTEILPNVVTLGEPLHTDAGIENGLSVAINNNLMDYFYTTISSPGVMIHVFVPTDYPDLSSGGLTEIVTQPNSENFIEIVPTTLTSAGDVADYPVERRGCLYPHEEITSFGGYYSQSDCNVDCRVRSIEAMCQCIPFMIPFNNRTTVCTLADIPCLNRYKDKWNSFFPTENVGLEHLQRERQDGLRCDKMCYSACEETVYEARANFFPTLNKTPRGENATQLYVYYLNRFSDLYRQDVVYYWFEILSNFGGIFGIFLGWSLISMLEFSFYFSRKIIEKFI